MLKRIKKNLAERTLLKNTIMLYILQFSTFFFGFITVPYQTRVMGPLIYGKLGFAAALMVYFQLFVDFGFMLSATAEVSHHRKDKAAISRIFTTVTLSKLIFIALSTIILFGMILNIPALASDWKLYGLFFTAIAINSLIPDYLYRGLEQMTAITVRTVLIKMFFTVMIFIFLKKPTDYHVVPILNIIGNLGAVIGAYLHLVKKMDIGFVSIKVRDIWTSVKSSSAFFYSRIATTVYGASNTVVLGLIDPMGISVGLYTSSDRLITMAKSGLSPISDSMYPYMIKNKDFKLIQKTLKIFMPIILLGCTVLFVFAELACVIIFGEEFRQAAPILRALLPVVVFTLPNYILGFPTLGAMGLARYANQSILFGTIIHITNLAFLYFTGNINMTSLAVLTSISEAAILSYRIMVIYRNRHLLQPPEGLLIYESSK